MAKVKGPLLSLEANGAFAKTLIFITGKQGRHVTLYHKPSGLPSSSQLLNRAKYRAALDAWLALSLEEKQIWNNNAFSLGLTGMNYFISLNINAEPITTGVQWDNGDAIWDNGDAIWIS